MSAVFIGGSRRLRHLPDIVRQRIDRIVAENRPVLVGDANGADKAVQKYLQELRHRSVLVFCMEGECRNNVGNWPVRSVPAPGKRKDFRHYAAKDRAMAEESDEGLMLWDGESLGTLANVRRLLNRRKTVVVFIVAAGDFVTVERESDWERLLSGCSTDLKARVDREVQAENSTLQKQETLF